ncbi:hypothetical protein BN7_2178 [Wickerhamomyces ciferrii]|uniref:Fibronectin type-III domain-containing protein n=1 Tax=Wickerhamomyces ciferrii (strain ATCC 14091 / BCRC 22168 / CBS 111 / JCM 3599 / NBRC 0793 / NRRL Y-1031 F-60-10) TaxID=1206466 RepID=K0KMP0_WICCF|nr:uncharacterized protein BN7_2178 [Wickerhamomyces ciferrii]CCH42634.1 hypothetical protein BN7_2178 [Wickerhamomyces ciferrii]
MKLKKSLKVPFKTKQLKSIKTTRLQKITTVYINFGFCLLLLSHLPGCLLLVHMYWTLTILSLAVLWLAYRLYVLAKVPVEDLVKTLKIEIPKSSKISVDNITNEKVHIHWDQPVSEPKVTSFVIYINGKQVSIINGNESYCCLSNLLSDTRYKIDLISINSKGYKAKSESIYVKTKSDKLQNYGTNILLENPENLFRLLTDSTDVTTVQKLATSSALYPNGEAKVPGRSRSATVSSVNGTNNNNNGGTNGTVNNSYAASTTSLLPDPRSLDDIEELRYYLESGQEELHTILNQQAQALDDFHEQEAILIEERDKLRERKKLEDGNRQSMKSEIKMLDDSRRLTELKKSKQENAFAAKEKSIEKMDQDLINWNIKIEGFEKQKSELLESEESIHSELDSDILKKKEKIKSLQEQIAKIDEDIKIFNSRKKQKDQLKPQFIKIFKSLADHTDSVGCMDAEGVKSLEILSNLDPEVHSKLQKEIELDAKLEAEWRAQQQREVNNCVKVSKAYEQVKSENAALKNPLNPTSSHSSTPPSVHSQPSSIVQQQIQQIQLQQQQQQQQLQQQQHNISSAQHTFPFTIPGSNINNSGNYNYNGIQTGSSPSLNSFINQHNQQQQQQQQQNPNFPSSSFWNYNASDGFAFNTTMPNASLNPKGEEEEDDDLESPVAKSNANHLLPKYLIDEDADFMKFVNNVQNQTPFENNSTANSANHIPPPSNSFGLGNAFNAPLNDSSANVSTRGIFQGDFGGLQTQPRFSLENPSSPPHSFNAELLSTQTSPSNNNDIRSVLSGNTNEFLPNTFQPIQPLNQDPQTPKDHNILSPFSPRRLSNALGFGKKNNDEHEMTSGFLGSKSSSQHSKFFGKANNKSEDHSNDTTTPLFSFSNEIPGTLDSVWKSPGLGGNAHNRNISVNSTHSNNTSFEREHGISKFFPSGVANTNNNDTQNVSTDFLAAPAPNDFNHEYNASISSGAISDGTHFNGDEAMQLTNTNKTSNTASIKSIKSTADNSSNISSSPSFFRKSKFLNFGGDKNQSHENSSSKTPSQKSSTLFKTISPTKSDNPVIEDSDVEDYVPSNSNNTTPKKLFSRNRKSSSSNMRKQSNSGSNSIHESDVSNLTDNSSHSNNSNSNGGGKFLVKKFFGGNKNSNKESLNKEIDDIDEQVEAEEFEK